MSEMRETGTQKKWGLVIFALVLILYGAILAIGGIWLAKAGGSWYYLVSGIAVFISGILLLKQKKSSATLFFIVFIATFIWTIWERGFNYWAWVPRLDVLAVLAFIFAFFFPKLGISNKAKYTASGLTGLFIIGALAVAFVPHNVISPSTPFPNTPLVKNAETTTDIPDTDWAVFGRDKNATRFSPLTQINADNVSQLQKAWVYRTGDLTPEGQVNVRGGETTPLKIGDGVYLCSTLNDLIKLDPNTGKEIWRHHAGNKWENTRFSATCRSVVHYVSKTIPADQLCHERIIEATLYDSKQGWRILAVDAKTGQSCTNFGKNGQIDLLEGMGQTVPGMVSEGSPPPIVDGVIVTNHEVLDGQRRSAPSGVIRGYSAETGELLWAWDVLHPERSGLPPPGETYSKGTPNSWGPMTGDDKLGLVYVPTGNSAVDYYSALRKPEENEVSSAVVALDVKTGKQRWVFQTVHKDVWDYDIASQPTLLDYPDAQGNAIPALIIPTKRGQLFVLNRETGKPLTDVVEKSVPPYNELADEDPHPETQPWSVGMPRLGTADLTEAKMWGLTPFDQLYCRIKFKNARYDGEFTAPTLKQPWIQFPGNNGGVDWGSLAYDPQNGVVVANWNVVPMYNQLLTRDKAEKLGLKAYDDPTWRPGSGGAEGPGAQVESPYAISVQTFDVPFTGVLCNEPPYGMITAIDMHTRQVYWQRPLGTARANGPFHLPTGLPIEFGVPSNAGPIITAGGLAFIAAATDNLIRAIDMKTGKVVWSDVLPAGGQATPMVYESNGQQYLVIMAGGHHYMFTPEGDYIIAYALPKK